MRSGPFVPAATALWAGLTGAALYALIEGAPLFLEGNLLPSAGQRLRALTLVMVLYGLTFSILLGMVGLVGALVLAALRRRTHPAPWVALYGGLLLGGLTATTWFGSHGLLEPAPAGEGRWATLLLGSAASLLLGGLAAGLAYLAALRWYEQAPRRHFSQRLAQWSGPALVITSALALVGLGLYRNVLRPAFPPAPQMGAATAAQPNIVLITVDSLRADHLGLYGYDPEISPNIDALARRGAYFSQAFAQAPWTMPSVAATITSLYPTELGVSACPYGETRAQLDPSRITLAEALQSEAFRTQAILTNVWLTAENGYTQGFDGSVGMRPLEPYDLESLQKRPLLALAQRSPLLGKALWQVHRLLFDQRMSSGQDGLLVNEYAGDFLRQHGQERFFLWLYYMEPHAPYNPYAAFPSLPAGTTAGEEQYLRSLDYWALVDGGTVAVPEGAQSALVALYDGGVHTVDAWIGQFLAELDRLELTERTLVIVHSDHGEEFLDHGWYGHGHTLHDELLQVPLVMAGPGIPPGQAITTPVQLLDLMPTLLDAAGLPTPAVARGRSLWPLLRGGELAEVPSYAEQLHTTCAEQKAVYYQGWKLIYDLATARSWLYNLAVDPAEQVDLAALEVERREEYERLLRRWLAEATRTAESLPRSAPLAPPDERVQQLLREGGY